MTPTCRESIAVGTYLRLTWRICSPNPGSGLCAIASVASGVTSRGAGPVPPVLNIRWHPQVSTSSIKVHSISACSSGMSRVSMRHGVDSAAANHCLSPGMPLSSYTPAEARSLIETNPIRSSCDSLMRCRSGKRFSVCAVALASFRRTKERAQNAKQLPIRARRLAVRPLGMNGADQCGKPWPICGGSLGAQPVQRVILGQQAFTPALEGVQPRFLGVRRVGPLRELSPDRRGIDVAHQATDELQLPAARLPAGDPLHRVERFAQTFGQLELGATRGAHVEQRFAQGLQCAHLCL